MTWSKICFVTIFKFLQTIAFVMFNSILHVENNSFFFLILAQVPVFEMFVLFNYFLDTEYSFVCWNNVQDNKYEICILYLNQAKKGCLLMVLTPVIYYIKCLGTFFRDGLGHQVPYSNYYYSANNVEIIYQFKFYLWKMLCLINLINDTS